MSNTSQTSHIWAFAEADWQPWPGRTSGVTREQWRKEEKKKAANGVARLVDMDAQLLEPDSGCAWAAAARAEPARWRRLPLLSLTQ